MAWKLSGISFSNGFREPTRDASFRERSSLRGKFPSEFSDILWAWNRPVLNGSATACRARPRRLKLARPRCQELAQPLLPLSHEVLPDERQEGDARVVQPGIL